ncbi:MAG: MBL fold metallo-hydrolase [Deltaproteobacteria bacterium]|nr:MBL fold metallo-hydrolase [Kofleriaceae bacterium]
MRVILAVALVVLAGCPAVQPPQPTTPEPRSPEPVSPEPVSPEPEPPAITWARVESPADLPAAPPAGGSWRIHMIDVGTGLAILVQGADFSLLFDAGSNDPGERPLRVVAYLAAALGPSGDEQCTTSGAPTGTRRAIDHVILSHPHQDHASALDLVLHCYDVRHVWDSGAVNDAVFYRDFLTAVSEAAGVTYHTASPPPTDRTIHVKGFGVTLPAAVGWQAFSEGDEVALGTGARLTLLHAEGKRHSDPNRNSIVVAVELGGVRLLLTGDAESGARADPSAALGDVEEHVVSHFPALVDADILQVGHHGSKTSSRRAFLDAVTPRLALVSAGPRLYKGTRLPDAEVLAALEAVGATVLRTDERDATCRGCDSWLVTIAPAP